MMKQDFLAPVMEGNGAIFKETEIQYMARLLPNQSKESVMANLGISANTWLKIKRGHPIRSSIAESLARRLHTLGFESRPDLSSLPLETAKTD